MEPLRVLDLFSGIGGFSLGLERTGGFKTVAFCEIEPFCRRVLAKHWPDVFIHDDIRALTKESLCRGYAANALLNQLCKETAGNSASVRNAITNIKKHAGQKTPPVTTNGLLSAEEVLSRIMAEDAVAAEKLNTHFWQSTINLITGAMSVPNIRVLYGSSLSDADFLTIIKFFVITATWQNQFTAPAPINDLLEVCQYDHLRADGIAVDAICGGFPCQDISHAGKGAGLAGERSGLWSHYSRLIGELRPSYVIVENVSALLGRGLAEVLGDLAALGFDAEWHAIPAAAVGAPHIRDRVWIIAWPQHSDADKPRSYRENQHERRNAQSADEQIGQLGSLGAVLADAYRSERRPHPASCGPIQWSHGLSQGQKGPGRFGASGQNVAYANGSGRIEQWTSLPISAPLAAIKCSGRWGAEPSVGRLANGIPGRVDRLKSLGNAVVPQIPELIGNAILASREAA